MLYHRIEEGVFLDRPNRFIAHVLIRGRRETVHVKNTGRCKELLVPGCRVWLEASENPLRKTAFDLVCTEKVCPDGKKFLINLDSQIPNAAAEEWLRKGNVFPEHSLIRREVTHENSRFDFSAEYGSRQCFMEVKGVTLEDHGEALFPDAPTLRGVKHLRELIQCVREGFDAKVLFVIQMKHVRCFRPNDLMHPEFGKALREAFSSGVEVLARDCIVTPDSMVLDAPVPVKL